MTQPLPLAQTTPSNQGDSYFGGIRALETKWRLGNAGLIPSAGAVSSKAKTAGKTTDFAQTLRDKKQANKEEDRASAAAPAGDERERTVRSGPTKATEKRAKKSDDKSKSDDTRAEGSSDASTSDRPASAEAPDKAEDSAPTDAAQNADEPAETDAQPQAVAAQAATVIPVVQPEAKVAAGNRLTEEKGENAKDAGSAAAENPVVSVPAATTAAKATAVGRSGAKADVGESGTIVQGQDRTAETTTATAAVKAAPGDRSERNAAATETTSSSAGELTTGEDAKAVTTSAANSVATTVPKRAKAAAGPRTPTPAESEAAEPGSKPESPGRAERAQASAGPAPAAESTEQEAPSVQSAAPAAEPVVQSRSVELKPDPLPARQATPAVDAVDTAAATASPRAEQSVVSQPTPSAELLRALAPAQQGTMNFGSSAPQAAAEQAAGNPDYQRLLGQQVERGIAQAIQQAAAATDAMITGTGAVVLRLHPANLGQLKVQIKFEGAGGGGGVRARFEASSSRAKGLLGESIDSLKAALEGRGLRVDEVVVAQSPRLPEPDLGAFVPDPGQNGQADGGGPGMGFAEGQEQPAPSFGVLASGASRMAPAETGSEYPTSGLGEQPVWLTGAAGWSLDADGNVRVDALV